MEHVDVESGNWSEFHSDHIGEGSEAVRRALEEFVTRADGFHLSYAPR